MSDGHYFVTHKRGYAHLSAVREEKAQHPTSPPLELVQGFTQSDSGEENDPQSTPRILIFRVHQYGETQARVYLRVLHIFDRPGVPSVLRERVH